MKTMKHLLYIIVTLFICTACDKDDTDKVFSIDDYEKIMKTYNIECAFIMPFNDPYMLSMEPAVEAVNKNMKNMRMIIKFS